ncbi:MAG: hypothetical protein AAGK78_01500 [Planctomycetota bacterium]
MTLAEPQSALPKPLASHAPTLAKPIGMMSPAGHPDAWHQVTAPGGYEWWYFDAEDPETDTHLVAILLEGFIWHPGYLRQFGRFAKRPHKHVPPVAGDFPCSYLVVYQGGKIRKQFMVQHRPEQFSASPDTPDVRLGPCTMRQTDDGVYRLHLEGTPWHLTGRGPQFLNDQTLTAKLSFTPTSPGLAERAFFSRAMTKADHRWVLAAPRCDVVGTLDLGDGEEIVFGGRGYHDHNFGTAPIGPGLERWLWGRVMVGADVTAFHYAKPRDASLPEEVHLLRAGADGLHESSPAVTCDWSRKSNWRLSYPQSADFGEGLRLSDPKIVDSAPFYMRLTYHAQTPAGQGRAFCEIAYPHRLRWPVLGRMVEMSIEKSALKQKQT